MYRIPEHVKNPRKQRVLEEDSDEDQLPDAIEEDEEVEEDHIHPKGVVYAPSKFRPWTQGELQILQTAWESIPESGQRNPNILSRRHEVFNSLCRTAGEFYNRTEGAFKRKYYNTFKKK